jgi:NitT/TauT family transport system ATP-binding protein
MDEPTSALDAMTKETLQGIILRQQQKSGATLILVTHDIEEAVMLGQYILILNEDGTLSMLDNPFFAIKNPREKLEFYDECIKIRKLMKLQS